MGCRGLFLRHQHPLPLVAAALGLHRQFVAVGFLPGQIKPEGGAHPQRTHHLHRAAVLLQNAAHDREAQTRAHLGVYGVFHPVEAFKNSLLINLADARARIGDLDAHLGQGELKGQQGASPGPVLGSMAQWSGQG